VTNFQPDSVGAAEVTPNIVVVVGINVVTSDSKSANTKIFFLIFSPPFLTLHYLLSVLEVVGRLFGYVLRSGVFRVRKSFVGCFNLSLGIFVCNDFSMSLTLESLPLSAAFLSLRFLISCFLI
jgi:uncharacterized membrane protein